MHLRNTKYIVSRILPFGLFWVLFSLVYVILERGILGELSYYPATGNPYSFSSNLLIVPFIALLTGFGVGAIEIIYLNSFFMKRTLVVKIVSKILIYLTILIVFLFVLTLIGNAAQLHLFFLDAVVWKNTMTFFLNFSFWGVLIYVSCALTVGLFYLEVSDNLGQSVLMNFIRGKYHVPLEEGRIFMFLDMKSSTTIAESIGHVRYFEMLKEYFADMTGAIINYSGEIYQYVGDEIVISWKTGTKGQNNNCIHCFFAIKDTFKKQQNKYIARFGLLPDFKAGLHLGKVTTGEIGVIKKDIIFTGDVLNTTARIQSLCNFYKTDLLLSSQLMKGLTLSEEYNISELGESELRGRDEKVELFTVTKRGHV